MDRPVYFAFISNTAPFVRNRVVETLVTVWTENGSIRPVLVNADPGLSLPVNNRKNVSDDPAAKYGCTTGPSGVPLLRPEQAAEFLDDTIKSKNSAQVKERPVVFFKDAVPPPEEIVLYDALCFAVARDAASIAFAYGAIRAMMTAKKRVPIRVLVVGTPEIDNAAAFYASLLRELKEVGDGYVDVSFAGFMSLNQEELELSSAYGLPLIEAFPKGTLHGQAKYAVRHLFTKDFSEIDDDWPIRERSFINIARGRK